VIRLETQKTGAKGSCEWKPPSYPTSITMAWTLFLRTRGPGTFCRRPRGPAQQRLKFQVFTASHRPGGAIAEFDGCQGRVPVDATFSTCVGLSSREPSLRCRLTRLHGPRSRARFSVNPSASRLSAELVISPATFLVIAGQMCLHSRACMGLWSPLPLQGSLLQLFCSWISLLQG